MYSTLIIYFYFLTLCENVFLKSRDNQLSYGKEWGSTFFFLYLVKPITLLNFVENLYSDPVDDRTFSGVKITLRLKFAYEYNPRIKNKFKNFLQPTSSYNIILFCVDKYTGRCGKVVCFNEWEGIL